MFKKFNQGSISASPLLIMSFMHRTYLCYTVLQMTIWSFYMLDTFLIEILGKYIQFCLFH